MKLDHLELGVPDRDQAIVWYGQWLGYRVMPQHAAWAETGPLMLTNDGGDTMLALFTGEAAGAGPVRGWQRTALRVAGTNFWAFGQRFRASGQPIEGPVDHDKSWSWYFTDPWGNAWEVTTYDHAAVREAMTA